MYAVKLTSQMTSNVIALGASDVASNPPASEAEVVGALTTDVIVAQVSVQLFWVLVGELAALPLTGRWLGTVGRTVSLVVRVNGAGGSAHCAGVGRALRRGGRGSAAG